MTLKSEALAQIEAQKLLRQYVIELRARLVHYKQKTTQFYGTEYSLAGAKKRFIEDFETQYAELILLRQKVRQSRVGKHEWLNWLALDFDEDKPFHFRENTCFPVMSVALDTKNPKAPYFNKTPLLISRHCLERIVERCHAHKMQQISHVLSPYIQAFFNLLTEISNGKAEKVVIVKKDGYVCLSRMRHTDLYNDCDLWVVKTILPDTYWSVRRRKAIQSMNLDSSAQDVFVLEQSDFDKLKTSGFICDVQAQTRIVNIEKIWLDGANNPLLATYIDGLQMNIMQQHSHGIL